MIVVPYVSWRDRRASFKGHGCCSRGGCVEPPIVIVTRTPGGPQRYYCATHEGVIERRQKARDA